MTDDVVDHGRRGLFRIGASALLATSALPRLAGAQPAADKLKIGVIGAGNIGGTIGGFWVMYGRRPRCKRNLTISEAFGCGHVFGL
jgi:hypothetical protein